MMLQTRWCVLRQAQDEVLSSWHYGNATLDVPHPELVEGRKASMQQNALTKAFVGVEHADA
jgi:hypothetical protein